VRPSDQPVHILRDAITRANAIRFYATAYDHFAQEEQVCVAEGRMVEAEGAHQFCRMLIRAYKAEIDDPEPKP
jgi:hypothetical protein